MTEPTTAAGRALLTLWLEGRTHPPSAARLREFTNWVLAIEAEARAAALDSARAAVDGINLWAYDSGYDNPSHDDALLEALAAIDALREGADAP